MGEGHMSEYRRSQKKVSASPGNTVTGIHEPPEPGTRNQTQNFFKSSEFELLSHQSLLLPPEIFSKVFKCVCVCVNIHT